MGTHRHRVRNEHRGLRGLFGRRQDRDELFERSFRPCVGCGDDVYVLAEACRECGTPTMVSSGLWQYEPVSLTF